MSPLPSCVPDLLLVYFWFVLSSLFLFSFFLCLCFPCLFLTCFLDFGFHIGHQLIKALFLLSTCLHLCICIWVLFFFWTVTIRRKLYTVRHVERNINQMCTFECQRQLLHKHKAKSAFLKIQYLFCFVLFYYSRSFQELSVHQLIKMFSNQNKHPHRFLCAV